MGNLEERIDAEIELIQNDHSLTDEEKENHIAALLREAKEIRQQQFREAYRLDKD